MLTKLKSTLARHPLAGFFALVGGAYIVYVGLAATLDSGAVVTKVDWMNRFSVVSSMVAGLAAVVCCWAISGPPTRPPRRFTQICIVIAVVLVTMTALCVEVWLQWRMDRGLFASAGGSSGVLGPPMPSLGSWIHQELGNTFFWLRALVAGLILAGVVSPFTAVRRLARALVSWRDPRVWALAALALFVAGACTTAASAGGLLSPLAVDGSGPFHFSVSYVLATVVARLLVSVPLVFAWYGFVDERLARRVSPLIAALVIGLAITLPYQVAVRIVGIGSLFGLPGGGWYVLSVLGGIALAVPAVWLVRKARGSLIPAALLFAAIPAGMTAATWTISNEGILMRAQELYPGCIIVAAVLFALGGRMWRRTKVTSCLPEAETLSPRPAPSGG